MKIVGVMLCRNESWIIGASIPAALRWVDHLVFVDHSSTDNSVEIAKRHGDRVSIYSWSETEKWSEMAMRQFSLVKAREHGATHIAIIDADEILTANLDDKIREHFSHLEPCEVIEVPMLAMRALDVYQDDETVWSHAWLTLGFRDAERLTWKPTEDGYDFHQRPPKGCTYPKRFVKSKDDGGVMHFQFSNRRRLVSKHWCYAYTEWVRWPLRRTKSELNKLYSMALERPQHLGALPQEWWGNREKREIKLDGTPWHDDELRRLISLHGEAHFEGIQLKERRPV